MTALRSFDPANGELVGEVEITPLEDIPAVIARARAAQPAWEDLGLARRAEILAEVGTRIRDRAEELGRLVTREMGKPVREAIAEVRSCAEVGPLLEEIGDALAPTEIDDGRTRSTIYRDPHGLCAAITPWNFPFSMPHWLVFPALAAGNAVILKPSEETPLCGQAYADILREVLPEDVLQVVHGADHQGKTLVAGHVDLIAFTGSRQAGKHILAAASTHLKRVILELGGKDPMIVLDDADLEEAARFAARSSFRNAGQVCVSTERIYVPATVAERFVDLLADETRRLQVGSGLEEGTAVGPMVSEKQRDHVLHQIRDAVQRGAELVTGGDNPRGNFITPTVLRNVTHEMEIGHEETFGPVACITTVEREEDAVREANDSPFGLGAVVFGGDRERAARLARRLRAGMIGINRGVGGAHGSPWVGARESGYGFHSSRDGHRQFTQTRVVSTASR
jgi:acyl-CoA reductase-like NAD-dependent aldehyde dehydrogenase